MAVKKSNATLRQYGDKEHVSKVREQIEEFVLTDHHLFKGLFSGRKVGKTTSVQKAIIPYCFVNGWKIQVMFPTDRSIEQKNALRGWCSRCFAEILTQYQVKYTTDKVYIRLNENDDWTLIMYARSIKQVYQDKLMNEPGTRYLVWDEAIQPVDPELLLMLFKNLCVAVDSTDRLDDILEVIVMGNPEDPTSPFFSFFGWTGKELDKSYEGSIKEDEDMISWYVPKPPDTDSNGGKKTRMASFMARRPDLQGTQGEFQNDYGELILEPDMKTKVSKSFCLYVGGFWIGFFIQNGILFTEEILSTEAPIYGKTYVIYPKDVKAGYKFFDQDKIKILIKRLRKGRMKFCSVDDLIALTNVLKVHLKLSII